MYNRFDLIRNSARWIHSGRVRSRREWVRGRSRGVGSGVPSCGLRGTLKLQSFFFRLLCTSYALIHHDQTCASRSMATQRTLALEDDRYRSGEHCQAFSALSLTRNGFLHLTNFVDIQSDDPRSVNCGSCSEFVRYDS